MFWQLTRGPRAQVSTKIRSVVLVKDFQTIPAGIGDRTLSSEPADSGLRGGLCVDERVLRTRNFQQLTDRKVVYTPIDRLRRDQTRPPEGHPR